MAWRDRFIRSMAGILAVAASSLMTAAPAAGTAPLQAANLLLEAEAGLGGICKPGRWMPVRISLSNDGAEVTGEIVLEWGGAAVHRHVTLASPSRVRLELYIRTLEVRETVTVRLMANGVELRSVDLPVRAAAPDEAVTLCVAAPGAGPAGQAGCTSTLAPEALPRSMRGYDAADRVVWMPGPQAALAADQHTAFERWQSYRRLEDEGLLSRAPTLAATTSQLTGPRRSLRTAAIGIGVYLLAILFVAARGRLSRTRPRTVYAAVTVLVGIWSSVGLAAGRIGPGRSVTVRHASTLRQLAGSGSFVSMRAAIEYPAFDRFTIRVDATDLAFAPKSTSRSEQWLDDDGYPYISGQFGFGSRQAVTLEGVVEFAPLDVVRHAGVVRVTNHSSVDLDACRFPEGFSTRQVGALRPGQAVEARQVGEVDEPFFACTLPESVVAFADPRHPVRTEGASLLTADLDLRNGGETESR